MPDEPPFIAPPAAPLRIETAPGVVVRIEGYVSEAEMAERLADVTAYGQRLRRELSLATDEVVALKHERDGLRQRVRQLEANMNRTMTDPQNERAIEHEVRRRLDRMMRERPRAQKIGSDE